MEHLTEYLLNQILNGNAILFLGAGASLESQSEDGIYGHSRFCNTDFDDKLACLNLSGV